MSQNTTESQEQHSPTTLSLLTNLQTLLERMQCTLGFLTAHLETFQELENDYSLLCKSVELPEFTLSVPHNGRALKLLLGISKLTLQQELRYVSRLVTTLKQSSTNTEPSNSSDAEIC